MRDSSKDSDEIKAWRARERARGTKELATRIFAEQAAKKAEVIAAVTKVGLSVTDRIVTMQDAIGMCFADCVGSHFDEVVAMVEAAIRDAVGDAIEDHVERMTT